MWAGHVALTGEMRNAYKILVGNPEGRRQLGRPRCRWKDNIKVDFKEIGWTDVECIHMAQDGNQWRSLVNTVMDFRIP
jgi:hypothetical protein